MSLELAFEGAAVITLVGWLLMRGAAAFGSLGSRQPSAPTWQPLVDALAPLIFGGTAYYFSWQAISRLAGQSIVRWLVALTPGVAYLYACSRFAAWRWRSRAHRDQRVRVHLKPDTPASWAIYIWLGTWAAWQICHALAPSLLPRWMR